MWLSLFHPQTERLFQTYGEILDFWTLMYEVHEIWIEYGIFFEKNMVQCKMILIQTKKILSQNH